MAASFLSLVPFLHVVCFVVICLSLWGHLSFGSILLLNCFLCSHQTSLVGSFSVRARKELLKVIQSYANMLWLRLFWIKRILLALNCDSIYELVLRLHMLAVVRILSGLGCRTAD